jgi:hypothetical protein
LFKDGFQFLLKYELHHLKEICFAISSSKLLKANCGNEGFYQFILGSNFFALVFYMILTLAKYAWNFFMSVITRDKDLQNDKKERIDKEN